MAATNFQIEVMARRALVELADGITDGPGIQSMRNWLGLVDSGRITDPSLPRQPMPKPLKPLQGKPLTNAQLDGQVREPYKGPTIGTKEWFDAIKARVTA